MALDHVRGQLRLRPWSRPPRDVPGLLGGGDAQVVREGAVEEERSVVEESGKYIKVGTLHYA